MMDLIDQPDAVRSGEELDLAKIDAYLKSVDPELFGAPEVAQYPGGASNLTYLVRYPNREFILRRPPFGHKAKSAHDMVREAGVIQALRPVYRYVPHVVAICRDPAVLDCDFYVMERLRGIIPRRDLPAGLSLDTDTTRRLCLNVIDRLIELHAIDPATAGLAELGRGEGYVARQITGWTDRYRNARTPDTGDFETVMAWLAEKMPPADIATCAIHNDYRFDNVVLDPERPTEVIGVLDWEMATLGDPLMDLANALAYWVQADDDAIYRQMRRQPTHLPGMLTRREVIDYYGERTGRRVDHFDFYEVYGLFRLAVIVQQIYYRYFHGQTRNPQFARFGDISNYLERRCLARIDASTL